MNQLLAAPSRTLPIAPLLQALGYNRATYYRTRSVSSETFQTPLPEVSSFPGTQTVAEAEETSPSEGVYQTPRVDALAPSRCRVPGRALTPEERAEILRHLYDDRFIDRTVQEIWATLLDEGIYLGSRRTFYCLLPSRQGSRVLARERRTLCVNSPTRTLRSLRCLRNQRSARF